MEFDLGTVHGWLRLGHIVPGFLGLIAFWVPVVVLKGGRWHRVFGQIFAVCALIVILSALASSLWMLIEPVSFSGGREIDPDLLRFSGVLLGSLAIFTLNALVLAIWAVWTRRTPERLAANWVRGLIGLMQWTCIGLGVEGLRWIVDRQWAYGLLLIALGLAGLRGSWKSLRQITDPAPPRMHWWYLHMEHMLTTGIAFHTAFAVFGLSRIAGSLMTGPWQLVPWLLPAAIGLPASSLWIRAYRQKFRDLAV